MKVLDEFGKRLMIEVRNRTITDWKMICNGKMKGQRAQELRAKLGNDKSLMESIVPEVVDTVLHHLLFWIENDPIFSICGKVKNSLVKLEDESSGFPGELFGENGWIEKFSSDESK